MKIKDNPELLEIISKQHVTTNKEALEFVTSLSDMGFVFDGIMSELNDKPKSWIDDPKYDGFGEVIVFNADLLQVSLKKNDVDRVAFFAFNLATIISRIKGTRRGIDIVQRFDAMSVEIDDIFTEFHRDGKQPKAVNVWNELVKRCGQPGSCCFSLGNNPDTDEQTIAWGRPGGSIDRMKYSTLQKRLDRKKRR